jgi:hypothetical protein
MGGNVVIGCVADSTVDTEFVQSLLGLLAKRADDFRGRTIVTEGYSIRVDMARNIVASSFLEHTDADFLLFLDSDMVFTAEDYDRLVQGSLKAELPSVVAGLYARADGQLAANVSGQPVDPTKLIGKHWYEVDSCGMGFTLIPRVVLGEIEPPWFDMGLKVEGQRFGDDTSFCYKAKQAGFPIYVDVKTQVGHLKKVTMQPKIESKLVLP